MAWAQPTKNHNPPTKTTTRPQPAHNPPTAHRPQPAHNLPEARPQPARGPPEARRVQRFEGSKGAWRGPERPKKPPKSPITFHLHNLHRAVNGTESGRTVLRAKQGCRGDSQTQPHSSRTNSVPTSERAPCAGGLANSLHENMSKPAQFLLAFLNCLEGAVPACGWSSSLQWQGAVPSPRGTRLDGC